MKTYYEILGISQTSSHTEIKEAAQAKANEIKVIFDVLADADKRKAYDVKLASSTQTANYYEILAIKQSVSNAEVKKVAQTHMDKMKTAFSVLYDPNKRKAYDLELEQAAPVDHTIDAAGIIELPQQPQASPYQPPTVEMMDMDEGDFELARRGARLQAYIIDTVLVILPPFIFIFVLGMEIEDVLGNNAINDTMVSVLGIIVIVWFLGLFVINMVLLYQNGQTIGKRMLAIKIVRVDGSRASLLRIIFMRALPIGMLSSIPIMGNLFFLVDALLIFQDSRRCLHDLIAGTIVINATKKVAAPYQTSISA